MNISNEEIELLVRDAYKTLQKTFLIRGEYRKELRDNSRFVFTEKLDRQFKEVRGFLDERVGRIYSVSYTPGPTDIVDLEALGYHLECIRVMYRRILDE